MRPGRDSNDAENTLEALTLSDRVRYVDLTRRLPNSTVSSVNHEKTERWTDGAWVEVDDGPTVTAEAANGSTVTVYDGTTALYTIAANKGFSFRAAEGEPGLYRFTFSYVSGTDTDAVRVLLNVEE
jgi:hypothetical protein